MKKILFLLLLSITFLISCEDEPTTTDSCDPTCSEWENCNEKKCELKVDRCKDDSNCTEKNMECDLTQHKCITKSISCTENEKRCSSDKKSIETCDVDGVWQSTSCETDKLCIGEKETTKCEATASCTENEKRCSSDKKSIETCDVDGVWQSISCETDKLCIGEKETTKCELPAKECVGISFDTIEHTDARNEYIGINGDYKLIVGFYEVASPEGEYNLALEKNKNYSTCEQCVTVSKGDEVYFQESGTLKVITGEAKAGESIGEILNLKLIQVEIESGTNISTPVEDPKCIEMETGKNWKWDTLCTEGEKRCSDRKTLEVCNATHSWDKTTCTETEICGLDNEVLNCITPFCMAGEKRCFEDNVQTCNDTYSAWLTTNCINNKVCDPETLTCEEPQCIENEKKCNADNSGIEICQADGAWLTTNCGDNELCSGVGDNTECAATISGEWIQVTANSVQSCGIKDENGVKKAYCWGTGNSGRLGTGNIDNKLIPTEVDITENSNWTDISTGGYHSCGIKSGKVYCWGKNDKGQLGDGTEIDKFSPTPLTQNNDNWLDIETGGYHSCGIKDINGVHKLYCWGRGDFGQLGNGEDINQNTPVEVSGENWESISLGNTHTCGIRSENGVHKLYCWGKGTYGMLGYELDGTTAKNIPTLVIGGGSWLSVSTGYDHTCGIKDNNKLYCWGHGNSYKLGTGTDDNQTIPTEVAGVWSYISSGYYHSCGIKEINGVHKLYCWGKGTYGRLGTGNEDEQTTPTEIAGEGWSSIDSGLSHNCALKIENSKNKLFCWGSGSKGRLGVGDTDNRLIPTSIE